MKAPFINNLMFTGKFNIPNRQTETVKEKINNYCEIEEKKLLLDVFGLSFYKKLTENENSEDDEQRIKDIINGADYTHYSGKEIRFGGIKSFSLPYVYYVITKSTQTSTTGLAEVQQKVESAISVNPVDKCVEAYNTFVEEMNECLEFIFSKNYQSSIYPEITTGQLRHANSTYKKVNMFDL